MSEPVSDASQDVQPVKLDDQVTPRTEGTPQEDPKAAPPALQFDESVQFVDPFEGVTSRVSQIKRPINVAQLHEEIAKAVSMEPKDLQISVAVANPDEVPGAIVACSTTNQGVLFAHPQVEEATIRQVISTHQADPHYGVDTTLQEWDSLREKILDGGELSNDEVAKALKILALKVG